jgi:hypothetical protein
MIEGKCSKCGTLRYGWALLNPRYQTCATCGSGLDIYKEGCLIVKGFSPFTAERLDTDEHIDTSTRHIDSKEEDKK